MPVFDDQVTRVLTSDMERVQSVVEKIRMRGVTAKACVNGELGLGVNVTMHVPPGQVHEREGFYCSPADSLSATLFVQVRGSWSEREIEGAILFAVMFCACHEVQEQFFVDGERPFDPHDFGNVFTALVHGVSGSTGDRGRRGTWNLSAQIGVAARKFFLLLDDES